MIPDDAAAMDGRRAVTSRNRRSSLPLCAGAAASRALDQEESAAAGTGTDRLLEVAFSEAPFRRGMEGTAKENRGWSPVGGAAKQFQAQERRRARFRLSRARCRVKR